MVFVSNVCRNHLVYGVMYQDCFAFISCTSYLIGIVGSDRTSQHSCNTKGKTLLNNPLHCHLVQSAARNTRPMDRKL